MLPATMAACHFWSHGKIHAVAKVGPVSTPPPPGEGQLTVQVCGPLRAVRLFSLPQTRPSRNYLGALREHQPCGLEERSGRTDAAIVLQCKPLSLAQTTTPVSVVWMSVVWTFESTHTQWPRTFGFDFSGKVVAVGNDAGDYKIGDEVYTFSVVPVVKARGRSCGFRQTTAFFRRCLV